MRVRPEKVIGSSTRNIMLLTALLSVAVALPLGSEYIFAGHNQKFLPLAASLNNDTVLIWLHFAMDALIGLSYVAISSTLAYLAWRARKDIPFLWMFISFGAFIVACGFTHLVSVWTIWQPMYYLAGGVKFVTAVASISVAVVLPRLIPQAIQLIDDAKSSYRRKHELEELNVALQEQKEELVKLNDMKDEFISLASHQLRTPATGVKQYLGMVTEGFIGDVPPKQLEALLKANESNERQIDIINDLLKVAQLDAGKVELKKRRSDLGALVSDVITEQKSCLKERNQKIVYRRPKVPVTSFVDSERMRMVIENLLSNASKYTPKGKRITVTVASEAGTVRIAVIDEGVGISKEDMPKLFYKFSRIDNPLSAKVGGTGLGLYWAKKIINLHDATLTVDSSVGKGSTFTISIPAQPA